MKESQQKLDISSVQLNKETLTKLSKGGFAVQSNKDAFCLCSLQEQNLSDNISVLNDFGLKAKDEASVQLKEGAKTVYVKCYSLEKDIVKLLESSKAKANIEILLENVLNSQAAKTKLNTLALRANLNAQEIGVLRSITAYANQLLESNMEDEISSILIKHSEIAGAFISYFHSKFDPSLQSKKPSLKKLEDEIIKKIDKLENIEEDKILRLISDALFASVRTNFFYAKDLLNTSALAIKYNVDKFSFHLNGVQPRVETFVFHNEFVGTHLRKTNVSRGGLRWSDRELDWRKEIKGLMQAQRSKNSVIIPSGAKGGFYIKGCQEEAKEKFVRVYKTFINALLDVVDNYKNKKEVRGAGIIYDDFDPYFVVAADKGTSTMSDTANAISLERGFWLGDAFASGGSKGFDHKDMGITAKGSLKAVERFFIEKNIDIYKDETKVIGIGSMSGDVFGNAMILSKKFSLLASIGSRYIFVDPHPDLEKSYKERVRLFKGVLGWEQYDSKLISKGGGVFKRSEKFIKVSPEMKEVFGIKKEVISAQDLIKVLLALKVDMLYNGGVGTYVRGNSESDASIGDKPNESVRIDASCIRAFCVCEGGNLGFSQKARVDYAKKGGKISADSIDNSAGVNTSDFEVNTKIILNALVEDKKLSQKERDSFLETLVDDVDYKTSKNNYLQGLALSLDSLRSKGNLERFKKTISVLKDEVTAFNPAEYELPEPQNIQSALTKDDKIARPLLCVLLSFSKIFVKNLILKDKEFFDTDLAKEFLYDYFPAAFTKRYKKEISTHYLKNNIMATMISNLIIDAQGSSFVSDYKDLGFEGFMLKIKTFLIINKVAGLTPLREELYKQDLKLDTKKQYEMFFAIDNALKTAVDLITETRNPLDSSNLDAFVKDYANLIGAKTQTGKDYIEKSIQKIDYVTFLPIALKASSCQKLEFKSLLDLLSLAAQKLEILELLEKIKSQTPKDDWQERLKDVLTKEILAAVMKLTKATIEAKKPSLAKGLAAVLENNKGFEKYLKDEKSIRKSPSLINISVVVGMLTKAVDGKN